MKSFFALSFLFFTIFYSSAQECEKTVVNNITYHCFYDGKWDISQDNLAMIEFVKSRSTGNTYIAYTTKDFLDQQFYNFSKNYNIDWGKYDTNFSLKNFKIFIDDEKFKFPFTYEQIFELQNFKSIKRLSRKRNKIFITTKNK